MNGSGKYFSFEEEPWEQEVSRLLSLMPEIEPPPGFIDALIDRRPRYGGRGALLAIGLTSAIGVGLYVSGWPHQSGTAAERNSSVTQLADASRPMSALGTLGALGSEGTAASSALQSPSVLQDPAPSGQESAPATGTTVNTSTAGGPDVSSAQRSWRQIARGLTAQLGFPD